MQAPPAEAPLAVDAREGIFSVADAQALTSAVDLAHIANSPGRAVRGQLNGDVANKMAELDSLLRPVGDGHRAGDRIATDVAGLVDYLSVGPKQGRQSILIEEVEAAKEGVAQLLARTLCGDAFKCCGGDSGELPERRPLLCNSSADGSPASERRDPEVF